MVDGVCQFTNASQDCTTWLNTCQGYQCGTESEYRAFLTAPGAVCPFGGQYPQPDDICVPINDTCQWYNPCRSWRGFCYSGYNCGTTDQYYQFLFGPQPSCAPPPPGWVEPIPPGECAVRNGQCDWYSKLKLFNLIIPRPTHSSRSILQIQGTIHVGPVTLVPGLLCPELIL